jgi:hypothetical protein
LCNKRSRSHTPPGVRGGDTAAATVPARGAATARVGHAGTARSTGHAGGTGHGGHPGTAATPLDDITRLELPIVQARLRRLLLRDRQAREHAAALEAEGAALRAELDALAGRLQRVAAERDRDRRRALAEQRAAVEVALTRARGERGGRDARDVRRRGIAGAARGCVGEGGAGGSLCALGGSVRWEFAKLCALGVC